MKKPLKCKAAAKRLRMQPFIDMLKTTGETSWFGIPKKPRRGARRKKK